MRISSINLFLALLLLFSQGFSQAPAEIFREFRPKICQVQFFKNVSSQSQIGSYIKIKQNRIGIIVSDDGLVMVNSDVYPLSLDIISGNGVSFSSGEPTDFKVKLHDGNEYEARFIGKDELAQTAFLRITDTLEKPLHFVQFSSSEAIEIGDEIYLLELLGESYNFEPLFTPYTVNSIITSPRRKLLVKNEVTALSAGGLVLTSDGKAVGITLRVDFDFSFQTPAEFDEFRRDFLEIAPSEWFVELIKDPPVLEKSLYSGKAWFGIGMQALTPELKNYWDVPTEGGVVIDRIYPQSPAEKAGLEVKDVIIAFDQHPLDIKRNEDLDTFKELIAQKSPGEVTKISIFRNGKTLEKKLTLASAPKAIDLAEKFQLSELGLEVRELTLDILYDYNFPLDTRGVYVFQVDRASPAGLGGLEVGSIITHVNGRQIDDLNSFETTIMNILEKDPSKIMFRIKFRRETQFIFVDVK